MKKTLKVVKKEDSNKKDVQITTTIKKGNPKEKPKKSNLAGTKRQAKNTNLVEPKTSPKSSPKVQKLEIKNLDKKRVVKANCKQVETKPPVTNN